MTGQKPITPVVAPQKFGYRAIDSLNPPQWGNLKDVVKTERERGNDIPKGLLRQFRNHEAIWVTHEPEHAARYALPADDWDKPISRKKALNLVQFVDVAGALPLIDDGDGGYLYVRKRMSLGKGSK